MRSHICTYCICFIANKAMAILHYFTFPSSQKKKKTICFYSQVFSYRTGQCFQTRATKQTPYRCNAQLVQCVCILLFNECLLTLLCCANLTPRDIQSPFYHIHQIFFFRYLFILDFFFTKCNHVKILMAYMQNVKY